MSYFGLFSKTYSRLRIIQTPPPLPPPPLPLAYKAPFLLCYKSILLYLYLDINECTTKSHSCDVNAVCQNTKGSYKCVCRAGYSGDGKKCTGNY